MVLIARSQTSPEMITRGNTQLPLSSFVRSAVTFVKNMLAAPKVAVKEKMQIMKNTNANRWLLDTFMIRWDKKH